MLKTLVTHRHEVVLNAGREQMRLGAHHDVCKVQSGDEARLVFVERFEGLDGVFLVEVLNRRRVLLGINCLG